MREYLVEILRGRDTYLLGEVFPGQHHTQMSGIPGAIILVMHDKLTIAEVGLEPGHVWIRGGEGMKERVEEAMDRLGQKARFANENLELIVQLSQL